MNIRQTMEHANRFILSPEALRKIEDYRQKLSKGELQPGFRLKDTMEKIVGKEDKDAANPARALDLQGFIVALIYTKAVSKDDLAALIEEERDGVHLHWTPEERSILGDLAVIYYRALNPQSPSLTFHKLHLAQELQLQSPSRPDYQEVVEEGQINEEAFYQLYKRRFLPLLLEIDKQDLHWAPVVTLGSEFGGWRYSSGPFKGKIGPILQGAMRRLLEEEGARFTKIICFRMQGEGCVAETKKINNILFRVFPQGQYPSKEEDKALGTISRYEIGSLDQMTWPSVLDYGPGLPQHFDPWKLIYTYSSTKNKLVQISGNEGLECMAPPPQPKQPKKPKEQKEEQPKKAAAEQERAQKEQAQKEQAEKEQDQKDFTRFVKLYHQHRKLSFFKNPWSKMLVKLNKGEIKTMVDLRKEVAKDKNEGTRSAQVLKLFDAMKKFEEQGKPLAFKKAYKKAFKNDGPFRNPWSKMHLMFSAAADKKRAQPTKVDIIEHITNNPLSRSAKLLPSLVKSKP